MLSIAGVHRSVTTLFRSGTAIRNFRTFGANIGRTSARTRETPSSSLLYLLSEFLCTTVYLAPRWTGVNEFPVQDLSRPLFRVEIPGQKERRAGGAVYVGNWRRDLANDQQISGLPRGTRAHVRYQLAPAYE